jgi:uncharacterized SAM-binding protein YcdF (DUF218 family)
VYDLVKTIVQPHSVLILSMGLTLLYIWLKRGAGRKPLLLLTTLWLTLFAVSALGISSKMLDTLRRQYPPPAQLPTDIDAIVTLGGGIEPVVAFRDRPEVDAVSFGRCLHTVAVYRQLNGCTVVVCGGKSRDAPSGPTVSEVMRDTLVLFGVDENDILVESESSTTFENAEDAARILKDRKLKKAILVTDARHMPRSVLCFEKLGVQVVPVASDFSLNESPLPWYEAAFPTADGLDASTQTFHEWLGMAWYWVHGRI